jgi:hypothetical protein
MVVDKSPLKYKSLPKPCKALRGLGAVRPEVIEVDFALNYALFFITM